MRFLFPLLPILALLSLSPAFADEPVKATVYKDPNCGCCREYVAYLRHNGFEVEVVDDAGAMMSVKRQTGVPAEFEGCHSTMVGGYVVEGHVPVGIVRRLLQEKPSIRGISLPGMPLGSPGMDGPKEGPFVVYTIPNEGAGVSAVYATE